MVQGDRLKLSRRLGAPLAASLALHAAVLGAIGPGGPAPALAERAAGRLEVQLAQAPRAALPPSAAPQRSEAPIPFRGPAPKKYFSSSELDERATPIEEAPLVYPETAYLNRLAGTVRMRIYISDRGQVERADVLAASPKGHFEQAALDAVRGTRFRPARKDGRPVPSQKLIEVAFDPYGPSPEEQR